jgi:hypothetical protein
MRRTARCLGAAQVRCTGRPAGGDGFLRVYSASDTPHVISATPCVAIRTADMAERNQKPAVDLHLLPTIHIHHS